MITRLNDRRTLKGKRVLLCRELIKLLDFLLDCGGVTCNIFVCAKVPLLVVVVVHLLREGG